MISAETLDAAIEALTERLFFSRRESHYPMDESSRVLIKMWIARDEKAISKLSALRYRPDEVLP